MNWTIKGSLELQNKVPDIKCPPHEYGERVLNAFGLNQHDNKVHVLLIAGDHSGCGYVRMEMPAKYLNREQDIVAFPTVVLNPYLLYWADILVWQRQYKQELSTYYDMAEKLGKTQVFELDDNLHRVSISNPAYAVFNNKRNECDDLLKLMQRCQILTVSRDALGKFYQDTYGIKQYKTLPNCIDFERVPQIQKNDSNKLRIGWIGSSTHQDDLNIIQDVITDLQKEYSFTFVMLGWDGIDRTKIGEELIELNDHLKGVKREYYPFVDTDKYMQAVADLKLDIGLCPVVNSTFNDKGKSAIKYLEYSALKIPSIVSDVSCYTEAINGTALVSKNKYLDWYKNIKKLIEDKQLRDDLAERAYNNIRENYNIETKIHEWANLYRELYKQQNKTNM